MLPLRERQLNQLFGVRTAEPLIIQTICEETPHNEGTAIHLLIHKQEGPAATVGFADNNGIFTFAFSTLELAESFVAIARQQNLLTQVGRILPMTVGEYFKLREQGWTKADLCIDPDPEMLNHPNIQLGIQISN